MVLQIYKHDKKITAMIEETTEKVSATEKKIPAMIEDTEDKVSATENKITAMIEDTEDKAVDTGSDTNYRDHKAMRVKQASFGSAPARDYLEYMVENEGTADGGTEAYVICHCHVAMIIVPILLPLAGLLLFAVWDQ